MASSPTTGSFATEQADIVLRRLAVQISRTIKSRSADEVHDLRVAIRRFTCILVVLKPCFPRGESRKIRRGLKKLMVEAGNVRDRDIAMRLLARTASSESGPLARCIRTEREAAAKTLATSLRQWVQKDLSAKWRYALGHDNDAGRAADGFRAAPAGDTAKRILPQMAREHFSCGKKAARGKASVEELHQFRLAAKNFRYTLDLFAPLYGTSLNGLLKQLKGVQTLLGDINDCVTVRLMLSDKLDSDKMTLPRRRKRGQGILAALKKRQRKKTEQFHRHWNEHFSSAAAVRQWNSVLSDVDEHVPLAKKPPARNTLKSIVSPGRSAANARTA